MNNKIISKFNSKAVIIIYISVQYNIVLKMNSDIIVTYKNTNEEEYKYDIWICKGKYKRTES